MHISPKTKILILYFLTKDRDDRKILITIISIKLIRKYNKIIQEPSHVLILFLQDVMAHSFDAKRIPGVS